MYVMFKLRPFTVHNVFPCFYGPNKVIIIIISALIGRGTFGVLEIMGILVHTDMCCDLVTTQGMLVIVRPVATAVSTHVCLVVAVARPIIIPSAGRGALRATPVD